MGRGTPRLRLGDDRGYSAAELLVVLAVLAVMATGYVALHRPSTIYAVELAAERLAREAEGAREQAVATEGEALVAVRPNGSYAARVGAPGTLSLASTPESDWEALPDGLAWGAGDVQRDPFGDAVHPLPAQVFCNASGACTPPPPGAVYLLRSVTEKDRVAAVTLGANGAVQAWRWEGGTGTWKPLAR